MLITISKFATPAEFIATGLTEAIFGIFSILGLIIVDAEVPEAKKIEWFLHFQQNLIIYQLQFQHHNGRYY